MTFSEIDKLKDLARSWREEYQDLIYYSKIYDPTYVVCATELEQILTLLQKESE